MVFMIARLYIRSIAIISSEFLVAGPPVKLPVTPFTRPSNCSLKSPSRHMQSRGGISDSNCWSRSRVSCWEGAILALYDR